jgi:hypothetical protein
MGIPGIQGAASPRLKDLYRNPEISLPEALLPSVSTGKEGKPFLNKCMSIVPGIR